MKPIRWAVLTWQFLRWHVGGVEFPAVKPNLSEFTPQFRLRVGPTLDYHDCVECWPTSTDDGWYFLQHCSANSNIFGVLKAPEVNSFYLLAKCECSDCGYPPSIKPLRNPEDELITLQYDKNLGKFSWKTNHQVFILSYNGLLQGMRAESSNRSVVLAENEEGKIVDVAALVGNNRKELDVFIGDGFLSGEGARWNGNSGFAFPDFLYRFDHIKGSPSNYSSVGTDLTSSVYQAENFPTMTGGECMRVNTSVANVTIHGEAPRIIACGGATAAHLAAQATLLQDFAHTGGYRIRSVVVSVGGSQLGFWSILMGCAQAYILNHFTLGEVGGPCRDIAAAHFQKHRAKAIEEISAGIKLIQKAMLANNYSAQDYRLILQTYPVPLPAQGKVKPMEEVGVSRLHEGCPFFEEDIDWIHTTLGQQFSGMLREIATAEKIELLDVQTAFAGHELCSLTGGKVIREETSRREWVRYMWPGFTNESFLFFAPKKEGTIQESLHPNRLGQRALLTCLKKHLEGPPANTVCVGENSIEPEGVKLKLLN